MSHQSGSYYDVNRIFLRGVNVRDIAEPLRSFDITTPAENARAEMESTHSLVAGVRQNGLISGYLLREQLVAGNCPGPCGDYAQPLENAVILADSASIAEVIDRLRHSAWILVSVFGSIGGIVTRNDLQDPPVRMWLFGLITIVEMHFRQLIRQQYPDEEWMQYISPARVEKARALLEERQRRNQHPTLLDCLQFSDAGQIIARDTDLREQAGFRSRNRADLAVKAIEALRNNLAHSQDIVTLDWETIVFISENIDHVIQRYV